MSQSTTGCPGCETGGSSRRRGGAAEVFPRTEKEKETQNETGCRSARERRRVELSQGHDLGDHGKGERLDAAGRIISPAPRTIQGSEADVKFAMGVQARVWGPQPGVRLAHRSYGILHCPRADSVAAGSDRAGAIALSEELE